MKKAFYLLAISVLLSSCGPDFILNEEQDILTENWSYEDVKSFNVTINDISQKYNLHLHVSHSKEYSYENLYMKIHTKFPIKEKREEQITIQLADKRGQWVGNCNSDNCTVKVYLLEDFKFPEKGDYTFSFEQFTRDVELKGIEKLQVQLFPIKT